jgi:hypothetical protein
MITISDEIIDSYYQKGGAPAIKKYIEEIIKYKYEILSVFYNYNMKLCRINYWHDMTKFRIKIIDNIDDMKIKIYTI